MVCNHSTCPGSNRGRLSYRCISFIVVWVDVGCYSLLQGEMDILEGQYGLYPCGTPLFDIFDISSTWLIFPQLASVRSSPSGCGIELPDPSTSRSSRVVDTCSLIVDA